MNRSRHPPALRICMRENILIHLVQNEMPMVLYFENAAGVA